jgi:hypothetical protein
MDVLLIKRFILSVSEINNPVREDVLYYAPYAFGFSPVPYRMYNGMG